MDTHTCCDLSLDHRVGDRRVHQPYLRLRAMRARMNERAMQCFPSRTCIDTDLKDKFRRNDETSMRSISSVTILFHIPLNPLSPSRLRVIAAYCLSSSHAHMKSSRSRSPPLTLTRRGSVSSGTSGPAGPGLKMPSWMKAERRFVSRSLT